MSRAAARVLRWERARRTRVELTFLESAAMRRLNRRATGRRGLTDVIAYALPLPDGRVFGDVYICPAAAVRSVRATGAREPAAVIEALVRLAVHGTLHVLGYDHPETDKRTHSRMWRVQERYVRRLLDSSRS